MYGHARLDKMVRDHKPPADSRLNMFVRDRDPPMDPLLNIIFRDRDPSLDSRLTTFVRNPSQSKCEGDIQSPSEPVKDARSLWVFR